MRSGRRPSPEGARLLFAGPTSTMICPADGPTEGRYKKTRRDTRREERTELKTTTDRRMSTWWVKHDTRDEKGRDNRLKTKTKHKVTKK